MNPRDFQNLTSSSGEMPPVGQLAKDKLLLNNAWDRFPTEQSLVETTGLSGRTIAKYRNPESLSKPLNSRTRCKLTIAVNIAQGIPRYVVVARSAFHTMQKSGITDMEDLRTIFRGLAVQLELDHEKAPTSTTSKSQDLAYSVTLGNIRRFIGIKLEVPEDIETARVLYEGGSGGYNPSESELTVSCPIERVLAFKHYHARILLELDANPSTNAIRSPDFQRLLSIRYLEDLARVVRMDMDWQRARDGVQLAASLIDPVEQRRLTIEFYGLLLAENPAFIDLHYPVMKSMETMSNSNAFAPFREIYPQILDASKAAAELILPTTGALQQ